eukprot:315390-Amphidinium_carterae.1
MKLYCGWLETKFEQLRKEYGQEALNKCRADVDFSHHLRWSPCVPETALEVVLLLRAGHINLKERERENREAFQYSPQKAQSERITEAAPDIELKAFSLSNVDGHLLHSVSLVQNGARQSCLALDAGLVLRLRPEQALR